ncbi:MAG: DUF975 family protein [Lachnospiraceae bacterium]|nr:DUF975 family protein [Lachnospiraceae bacterium]
MHEISSPAQLKASARNSLNGHYSFLIAVHVTNSIIVSLFYVLMPIAFLTPITSLIAQLFSFHICRIYLMTFCGKKASIKELFIGNPDRVKEMQTIYAACIITLIQFLCMLPCNILSYTKIANNSSTGFLLYCITLAAGLALYYYIYFSLFPIYYLVTDCPGETIIETLKIAVFISKGHRFRLFYLIAGFLPLYLLSLLSFGIGLLWVIPYMQATLTHYYLNLTASKSN